MALQTRSLFVTSDGKEFKVQAEAEAHQAGLDSKPLIEGYITHSKLEKAQAGLMRRHLAAFLAFQETFVEPEPAPVEASTGESGAVEA